MRSILIADDSPVELHLASGLLESAGWNVRTATDGTAALAAATAARPDVVVTDLRMPGLDGLELLEALQEQCGNVPVVIITSRGTEEVAVEALRRGAAGYIPKRRLGADLLEVVTDLFELARSRVTTDHWESCVTRRAIGLQLPNDGSLLSETVRKIQNLLAIAGFEDERIRLRIGVALHEALVNAMVHGNLEVSSTLREREDDAYERLIATRSAESPFRERHVYVEARVTDVAVHIEIRDEGPGFDVAQLPDPTDPENLFRCSGRGVLMMRSFMDEVLFNETGNVVSLTKFRSEPPIEHDTPDALKASTHSDICVSAT